MVTKLEDKIRKTALTKSQKKIAQYILDNKTKVAFTNSSAMAKELGISDSTVLRLCRTLGYSSFKDMRDIIQHEIEHHIESSDNIIVTPQDRLLTSSQIDDDQVVSQIVKTAIKGINGIFQKNSAEKFDEIAEIMYNSKNKVLIGTRGAQGVIEFLHMSFSLIMPGVKKITSSDANSINPLFDIYKGDAVFIYSCSRYPKVTMFGLEVAKERGAKVILMTDRETSPLVKEADIAIIVNTDGVSHFNSNIVATTVAEIISSKIARLSYKDNVYRYEIMEKYTKSMEYFVDDVKHF